MWTFFIVGTILFLAGFGSTIYFCIRRRATGTKELEFKHFDDLEYLRQKNSKTNVTANSPNDKTRILIDNSRFHKDPTLCTSNYHSSDSCQAIEYHLYDEIVMRTETNQPDTEYDPLDHSWPANYDCLLQHNFQLI